MSWEHVDTSARRQSSNVVFRLERDVPFTWSKGHMSTRIQPTGAASGDEMIPLVKGNRRQPQMSTTTAVVAFSGVCLWFLLILIIGLLYWDLSATMTAARAEFKPYALAAINHTMSILANADGASVDAHGMLDEAHALSNQALPALERALNQSSSMVDRLERLAQNPVLQISMQQGGALGGAGR